MSVFINPLTDTGLGKRTRKAYIQLPAFEKSADECLTGFEKWIYILKNMETMREMPFKDMSDRVLIK